MQSHYRVLAVALGAMIGSSPATAQRVDDLPRGAKVRVLMQGGGKSRGSIDTVTTEVISLDVFDRHPEGDRLQLRRDLVTNMQVFRKTPGKGVARGALLGLLVGGGTFFIIGALTYSDSDCDILACSREAAGGFAGIWGALIGIPAGMIWGASRHEWRDVAVRQ